MTLPGGPRPEPSNAPGGPASEDTVRQDGPTTPPQATQPSQTPVPQSERYQVLDLLGTGGMGKVFKAFDHKLKRPVALKFLRGQDPVLEQRFLREAQSQARVDHAHVCKVYEVGRIGDDPYIAMQFIDGKTLRDAAREMTVAQKVAVLRDIAEAVHGAHKLGLVHRDLKPANILIERGPEGALRPFVTDFGLARDSEAPGDTLQGALLGTPQYMAPEQARGEHQKIDARTDVYGLGATLYEALSGKPPFEGGTHLQTLFKMLNHEPPPLPAQVPPVPPDVESIVLKCLEKEPGRRYQSARELAEDLQRSLDGEAVRARPASLWRKSQRLVRRHKLAAGAIGLALALAIPQAVRLYDGGAPMVVAVADFVNQTGDEGLDGLSGMLITSLEQSRKLNVLTRSRMFDLLRQLGRKEESRIDETLGREVAEKAFAQALLVASIRRFDDLYVIDLKVLDPHKGEYLAALKEEGRGKANLPRMIDRLSDQARAALKDTRQKSPTPALEQVTTKNLEAYQRYFRGEELVDHLQFARAAEQYRAAIAIDPQFALAWYRLAYSLMWMHDGLRGRESIERALQLAEKLPEKERLLARGVRGSLFSKGQDAYDVYKECVERYPSEKECVFMLGDVIFHAGYPKYALPQFRSALALDPAMERAHQHLLWSEQLLGDSKALLAAAHEYVAKVGNDDSYGHLGRALASLNRLDEARAVFEQGARLFPSSALPPADLAALSAWKFDTDAAAGLVAPLLGPARAPRERLLGHLVLGGALVQGGRAREAIAAFEAAAADARDAGDGEQEAIALSHQGLVRFLYLRDAEGARKVAREAVARGVPETMFAFLYPLLGDLDRYGAVLRTAGDPLADKSVAAFQSRVKGDFTKAAEGLAALSDKSPYRDFLYYVLADCWMQAGEDEKALAALLRAQATFPGVTAPGPGAGGMFRARSDNQLGILYERTGQRKLAAEATARFLAGWTKADEDLPELKEARARLARLQASGGIELR